MILRRCVCVCVCLSLYLYVCLCVCTANLISPALSDVDDDDVMIDKLKDVWLSNHQAMRQLVPSPPRSRHQVSLIGTSIYTSEARYCPALIASSGRRASCTTKGLVTSLVTAPSAVEYKTRGLVGRVMRVFVVAWFCRGVVLLCTGVPCFFRIF